VFSTMANKSGSLRRKITLEETILGKDAVTWGRSRMGLESGLLWRSKAYSCSILAL
jgi:hypothetical protein